MNKEVKIIWGSDTGNTEVIVDMLVAGLELEAIPVSEVSSDDWNSTDIFMLAIPTWYDGDLQSDWEDYFDQFKTIDFTNKYVCILGLGDQEGYAEYFVDGIGILAQVVLDNGGSILGKTSTEGYDFEESKAEVEEGVFFGLALDFENQDELTEQRVESWISQLVREVESL